MKFLHTADWQIGMKADSVGQAGSRVREARFEAGESVIDAAKKHGAEFILVAGDLFEDNAVDSRAIQRTADILASFGKPVYIIPGNHDPYVPGSVWGHPAWGHAEDLHVLHEETPVEGPGCLIFPCPVMEKYSAINPILWIDAGKEKGIKIGLAHGTVEGVQQEELDYPIPRDAAEKAGLDYLALGHWHSTSMYTASDGSVRMAYSGTHEQSKFGERDSGNVLLVEIEKEGAVPELTWISTGQCEWEIITSALRAPGDPGALRERIEAMERPERRLLRVELSGLLTAEDQQELTHLDDILSSRFLYGRLDITKLRPAPGDDWVSSLPHGVIREAAARLIDMASSGAGSDEAAQIASRALLELYALAGEVE